LIWAVIVGVLAGGATLAIGQIAFATVRTPLIRASIGLLYAMPAAIAGYHASLGLAAIGVAAEGWRMAFAVCGAVFIGATAFARMARLAPSPVGQRSGDPAYSPPGVRLRDQMRVPDQASSSPKRLP
jgi:hypothetical protein